MKKIDIQDFIELDNIAYWIGEYCRKWGRLGGQTKEKYGTIRFYASFGGLSLHTLIYPGYVYSQFPNWLWKLDIWYISPVLQFFFEGLFVKWQMFIYKRAYIKALYNWPQYRREIMQSADYLDNSQIDH